MNSIPSRRRESGNILFWILIATVLFAALSYAVAEMMRSGSGDSEREMRKTYATEITQFTDALRKAVHSMRIDGVDISAVSFENTVLTGAYVNASCAAGTRCRLFESTGGNLVYQAPEAGWLDSRFSSEPGYGLWLFPSDSCVRDYPAQDAADCKGDTIDNEDLMVVLPYVAAKLCMDINTQLGIDNPGGDAPAAAGCHGSAEYTGSFSETYSIDAPGISGKAAGCFKQPAACDASAGGYYVFYRVLAGR